MFNQDVTVLNKVNASSDSCLCTDGIRHVVLGRKSRRKGIPTRSFPKILSETQLETKKNQVPVAKKIKKNPTAFQISDQGKVRDLSIKVTKECARCFVTKTPQWRQNKKTGELLCNACGLRDSRIKIRPSRQSIQKVALGTIKKCKSCQKEIKTHSSIALKIEYCAACSLSS